MEAEHFLNLHRFSTRATKLPAQLFRGRLLAAWLSLGPAHLGAVHRPREQLRPVPAQRVIASNRPEGRVSSWALDLGY
jgi:hypothetical protein